MPRYQISQRVNASYRRAALRTVVADDAESVLEDKLDDDGTDTREAEEIDDEQITLVDRLDDILSSLGWIADIIDDVQDDVDWTESENFQNLAKRNNPLVKDGVHNGVLYIQGLVDQARAAFEETRKHNRGLAAKLVALAADIDS
jgi:hypothetical protein